MFGFRFYTCFGIFRVKDNKFVYCALRLVIISVLEKAKQLGVKITQIIHKTDRPSSQFWNSGMVLATKELVAEFGIPITHITEQSMHNKVHCVCICVWYAIYFRIQLMVSFLLSRLP